MIRVLVVDDDFRVADLHAQFVRRAPGFEVVGIAHDAARARQAVADLKPDLVLLDMYLPDGLGLDLVPELACDVLMVTAAADAETVRRAVGAGVVNYVIKPFPPGHLIDRLQAYAQYRRQLAPADRTVSQLDVDRAVRSLARVT